jgi:hypothetical protein
MELFHTSPTEITEINTFGRFGEFLCFADEPYSMSAGEVITYRIDIIESDIIEASRLFYHDDAEKLDGVVHKVMDLLDCDSATAEDMLSQRDDCGDAELSWDIQALTAQAAKLLGYRGVSMPDEQGTCYMIDLLGHEGELERV